MHALINLIDSIGKAIDSKEFTIGVFLDLSKAFDTVNHSILLNKLKHYGINGRSLDWLSSYLSNRKQFTAFNDEMSNSRYISCGVPQGSILGPLLFLIYVNDLPNASRVFNSILFADDTNLFHSGKDPIQLISTTNIELTKIADWFAIRLSLNLTKTHYLIFSS